MTDSLCECGHPFAPAHQTPGAECAVYECDCSTFRAATTPEPARVLVVATIVVPGDQAMPLQELEAYIAQAFKQGGVLPVRVDCEFIEEAVRV